MAAKKKSGPLELLAQMLAQMELDKVAAPKENLAPKDIQTIWTPPAK